MLKLDPKNTELLAQKQTILNQSISTTEDKLKQLKQIKEEADKKMAEGTEINEENYRALQREIINTQNKLSNLKNENSGWNKTGNYLTNLSSELDKISHKVDNLGNKLTSKLTLPIASGFALSIKEAIEFESAFTGVIKTVDGTEQQLEELKEGIQELSKEIPSTTTEIAAVAESAGQLGIQTENILSFSKAMIDLGNSTNLTSEEAASQLAKFANIMQMSQEDFDRLGSAIVDLGNNFATTEVDIVNMAMRLAGAGKQVGLSEGQVLGLATALSSVGIEAEMGGSAISKAMVKMQNAVEQGGSKLDSVLEKTGMTLRELELMAANDSMGFKEMSQSIGMTSTEVKQLITAGANLEDFAKISGMTAEEFKKAWKEDAAGALSAFIKGLGDAENKGESAITMLSEMGLTEVRLRDSLLRAANAGDLFNNAIETGTKAWSENIALTKEADKRYGTTESQFKITMNRVKDTAITLGNKLLPVANKLLDKADKFIDSLDNLSDEEQENIIKIGLMVAAAGPLLKIGSTAISTISKVSKGIGTMSQAIGVFRGEMTSSNATINATSKIIKALASPAGVAIGSIGALAGAYTLMKNEAEKIPEELQKTMDKMEETKKAHEEYRAELDKTASSSFAEIENTENLRNELSKLVDENGKVKEGYKDRVSVILNELNKALGTEYSLTGDIISQYQTLQEEIDLLILKKKAQIVLENEESKYSTAIQNKTNAYQTMIKAQNEYNNALEGKTYEQYFNDLQQEYVKAGYTVEKAAEHTKEYMAKWVDGYKQTYESSRDIYKDYLTDIAKYENDYAIMQSDNTEKIKQMTDERINNYGRENLSREAQIQEGIQQEIYNINELKKLYQEDLNNQNEISAQANASAIESSKQRLENLLEDLTAQTSIINENSPEIIDAWKQLATNSYSVYYDKVSQLPEELSKKIQEMTGVTVQRTPELVEETKNMSNSVLNEFKQNEEFRKVAIDNLEGLLEGLEDEELRNLLNDAGFENVEEVIKGIKEGNLAEEEGERILKSLNTGLSNSSWQNTLWNKARSIASTLSSLLTVKANVNGTTSNLPGHKSGLDFVPYDNYIARLHKGERVLTAEENKQLMKMEKASNLRIPNMKSIGKSVMDSIKTVFTTPTIVINAQDELTPNKINSIIDTVNRRLGSQY